MISLSTASQRKTASIAIWRLIPALAVIATFLAISLAAFNTPVSAQDVPGRPPAQSAPGVGTALGGESQAEIWRKIRGGAPGNVVLPGVESGVLIQSQGEIWRLRRNEIVTVYGGWALLTVLGVLVLFFLIRGRMKIDGGRGERVIPRFSLVQRVVHWFVAALFVILGVSGLILLFGKHVLRPLIGPEAYSAIASASLQGHNLFGPLFIPAILALLITFIRGNFFRLVDLKWIAKGGGFFGGHAPSDKYNFGEKTWFWWSVFFGLVLCGSGLMLLFPWAVGSRELLQFANLAHAGAAIFFIAFGLGHIYLGAIGMEGALEGMTRGTVDENWAKQHHDIWYEKHKKMATTDQQKAESIAAATGEQVLRGAE